MSEDSYEIGLGNFDKQTRIESASDFMFVWSDRNTESVYLRQFSLSSKDEGRIIIHPFEIFSGYGKCLLRKVQKLPLILNLI